MKNQIRLVFFSHIDAKIIQLTLWQSNSTTPCFHSPYFPSLFGPSSCRTLPGRTAMERWNLAPGKENHTRNDRTVTQPSARNTLCTVHCTLCTVHGQEKLSRHHQIAPPTSRDSGVARNKLSKSNKKNPPSLSLMRSISFGRKRALQVCG